MIRKILKRFCITVLKLSKSASFLTAGSQKSSRLKWDAPSINVQMGRLMTPRQLLERDISLLRNFVCGVLYGSYNKVDIADRGPKFNTWPTQFLINLSWIGNWWNWRMIKFNIKTRAGSFAAACSSSCIWIFVNRFHLLESGACCACCWDYKFASNWW